MSNTQKLKHNQRREPARTWEFCALFAAIIILTSPFIYKFRASIADEPAAEARVEFAGTPSCKACHLEIYNKWQGSDHDRAMATATDQTVLGDFNNVWFTDPYTQKQSRFFRQEAAFKVETEGPDGKQSIFTISHTFGFFPLQQYLIPFPGGRLQCLPIAWDIQKKQWYRLPPYDVKGPDDWLHWTKGAQTWNGMCAECHSTRLEKNYDLETNTYSTSWFEINVGCESCHGSAALHVEWAERPPLARAKIANYGLGVQSSELSPEKQIVICAPCHSRRFQLGNNFHEGGELLDLMVPSLLTEGLYHADGQIEEEVYVYGSYTQSKMYNKGVRCSDCHDMHSLKTFSDSSTGNNLCLQCHRASEYDNSTHHFHKKIFEGKPSKGYLCVKCHMPGQYYMGIDYRPDHSLRIPRPDLSKKLGTPNGCTTKECHGDKTLDWAVENYTKWYGQKRKPHYGEIFAAARAFKPNQGVKLRALAGDELLPAIVRSTALSHLRNYPSPENLPAIKQALASNEALLRHTALNILDRPTEEIVLQLIAPKLYDPVKAVRFEAALKLARVPLTKIREQDREVFDRTLKEYRLAMEYNSDFAPQRFNLGNLEQILGNSHKAIEFYQAALNIDDQFIPAKVNLAMEYNKQGKNIEAEQLLRQVVAAAPRLYETSYSLGLLLSEMEKYEEAAVYLGKAADGMENYSRARYNQGLALLKLNQWEKGADTLKKALFQDPANEEYFITLVKLYLNFRMNDEAMKLTKDILNLVPDHIAARELLQAMNRQ